MSWRKPIAVWLGTVCAALISLSSSPAAQSAVVTKIFAFNGAVQLWTWNTAGKTMLGEDVTPETLPMEMTDPARLSWYDADGTLLTVYRNYRPGEFQLLNDWKAATGTKLARLNLAGEASGTGERTDWGEMLTVTGIGDPPHDPLFDGVGTNWFAQTAWDPDLAADAPGWWCDAQADGIGKDLTGAFMDRAQYTFDDSAINPDGTVTLWFSGLVTEDLAGVQAGTVPYGILEGAMRVSALSDDDGDGYLSDADCDDSPVGDPAACSACSCGVAECAGCARCIYPGAVDFPNDAYDSNCSGQSYDAVANSIAASYGRSSLIGSGVCNQIFLLLLPFAAILLLRGMRRRK
jgi:hypothetical protein